MISQLLFISGLCGVFGLSPLQNTTFQPNDNLMYGIGFTSQYSSGDYHEYEAYYMDYTINYYYYYTYVSDIWTPNETFLYVKDITLNYFWTSDSTTPETYNIPIGLNCSLNGDTLDSLHFAYTFDIQSLTGNFLWEFNYVIDFYESADNHWQYATTPSIQFNVDEEYDYATYFESQNITIDLAGLLKDYADGYNKGHQDGYSEGVAYAISQGSTATTIFAGIIDVALLPINFFLACLNFEVFGINIGAMVTATLTIAILVILFRTIFAGGNGGGDK